MSEGGGKKMARYSSDSSESDDDEEDEYDQVCAAQRREQRRNDGGGNVPVPYTFQPRLQIPMASPDMGNRPRDARSVASFGMHESSLPIDWSYNIAPFSQNTRTMSVERCTEMIRVPSKCPDAVFLAFFEHGHVGITDFTDWVVQRRMKWVSPSYEHCQIVFMWNSAPQQQCPSRAGTPTYVTFSTNKERPSLYTNPAYKNENWRGLSIPHLNRWPEARKAVFEWCDSNRHAPFNTCAFYWNFIPPASCCSCCQYDARGSSFFCAEQVARALAQAQVPYFDESEPWNMTPDSIYDLAIKGGGVPAVLKTPTFVFPRTLR
jgi:hypothetical protein